MGYDKEKEEKAEQEAKMAKIAAIEEAKQRDKLFNNPISPEWDVCIPEDALLELDVLELDGLPEGDPDLEVLRLQILPNEK